MKEMVEEIDVLIATAKWLWHRKILPYCFSVSRGNEGGVAAAKERLIAELDRLGLPGEAVIFSSEGPDIKATDGLEWWQIECKRGEGRGKKRTQQEHFLRGLSSVVSYYEETVPDEESDYLKKARPVLGLALPATPVYLHELRRKVRKPLRQRLNLWILLYDPKAKAIRAVSPDDDY